MRRVIDILIVLMLVAVLIGLVWHYRAEAKDLENYRTVHDAMSRLYEQALFHGTLDDQTTKAGFPLILQPKWFGDSLPVNVEAGEGQPWLDIAPLGDMSDHPPDPIIYNGEQAGFWYNPNRGLFRARVRTQFTDEETLALYNQLNNTALKSMPRDPRPERKPVSLEKITAAADRAANDVGGEGSTGNGKVTSPAPKRPTLMDVKTRK